MMAFVGVSSVGGVVPPLPANATTRWPDSSHVNPRGLVSAVATGVGSGGAAALTAVAPTATVSAVAAITPRRSRTSIILAPLVSFEAP